jgi:hypothetical protein
MSTYCEDFPCCGHEAGDCDGNLYGSDENIKARVYEDIRSGHGDCDHQDGIYNCDGGEPADCEDEDHECVDCDQTDTGWECSWCDRPCPAGAHEGVTV